MSHPELMSWLAEAGLHNRPLEELVDGFSRRLNDAGVPVAQVYVAMNTLHPLVRARSLLWDRATGPSTHAEFQHSEVAPELMAQHPLFGMVRDGIFERRVRLDREVAASETAAFSELTHAGMTDWLGRLFAFGELGLRIGQPEVVDAAGALGFGVSLATDRAGGFEDGHLASLSALLPLFALAVKATSMSALGHGLLAAYLGTDPARRVLAGSVQRGEVQSVEAVLLYADLRSFTQFADSLPGNELMVLLDSCFDCMVRPVSSHGGEVLKFLGDGLLAIFRVDDRPSADITAAALDAASEALALMETLAAKRAADGKATPGLDIALHIGKVLYGNVGTDARLDFTVIGPAVNEAARIEFLCKSLGHNLLISQAFATAAGAHERRRLVPVGRHALRGVREETELFALAQRSDDNT